MPNRSKEVLKIEHNGLEYTINIHDAFDLSIPNNFSDQAPTFYNSTQPTNIAFESKQFTVCISFSYIIKF